MLYLDYAKSVANGYILNFFADSEEDITEVSNGKHFITKNGTDYGVPQPSSTVVITMPDKTKKTYVLNEAGEWQEGGVEMDYSKLTNAPITLANLADKNFIPEVNTYYEHLGETTEDFVKGIIYLYNGAEYKAIDGSGSGAGVQPDYDQNDPTQPDYIKNRPFYVGEATSTEVADFKVISGNLLEAGSAMTVEYNGERFTGTVEEKSASYKELSIGDPEKDNFACNIQIESSRIIFACAHKKQYEVKADDEVIFNGIKYIVKSGTNPDLGEKLYISDGEINFETLEPSTASFIYIFGIMETDTAIMDYYIIFKSTSDINFNLKTYQQAIKTIDPKYIKDMYYTKSESDIQKILLFKGEITLSTQISYAVEVGDIVYLKEEATGLDATDTAKFIEVAGKSYTYAGNFSILAPLFNIEDAVDTKEEYCALFGRNDNGSYMLAYGNKNKATPNNIEVYKGADPIVRIPEKYLPLEIAKKDYVDTAISNAITKALSTEV